MSFWPNTYSRNKFLFIFFLLFVAGQTVFTIKGVETFPFWNYGMYSAKMNSPTFHETYELHINNQNFNTNSVGFSKAFLEYQLRYFIKNKIKQDDFGNWLKRYLQKFFNDEILTIKLLQHKFYSNLPYKKIETDEYSLYQ
jgi:hypothetical protein